MVRHAVAAEDKQARREAILEAASALFLSGDGGLPAAARIAETAGLAKGTLYLYFRTKEEIFISILLQDIDALLSDIAVTFETTPGRRAAKVAAFLSTYASYLDRHPELLRLDSLGYGVLEQNLEPDKLRAFKLAFAARMAATGAVVDRTLRLPAGRAVTLLMRTFALTRGLWQSSHRPDERCRVAPEPTLAALDPDFDKELAEALTEYWRGALAAP